MNRSLIVDAADEVCLQNRIMEWDYSSGYLSRKTGTTVAAPTVSGFTPSESSSSSAGRTYKRCRYTRNGLPTAISDYTLTPTSFAIPEASNPVADPRLIIGDNDRHAFKDEESSGIVYMIADNSATMNFTGFIVGDHQIATAAHCVYKSNKWCSLKIKTSNSDGNVSNTTLTPIQCHVPQAYNSVDSNNGDHMYDYALITVLEDLSDYVHFSLGTPYNVSESAYSNIPIYVTGYPLDYKILQSAEGRVVEKILTTNDEYTDIICHNVDETAGQSGSPIYTITKIGDEYIYTAIGIVHGGIKRDGRNWGSMVTNYHLQFYLNNPNASYEAYWQ